MEPSKGTTRIVGLSICAMTLGYMLASLSSYLPWYQYVVYDMNEGLFVGYIFLGEWRWSFAIGVLWTQALTIFRQALFLGGLFGGFLAIILWQVLARKGDSLCLAAALLNIVFSPFTVIPCLLVAVHGSVLLPEPSIPEASLLSQGFALGFVVSFVSVALILAATIVMLSCRLSSHNARKRQVDG